MSLLDVQAQRKSTWASFSEACVYAGQAVAATLLVLAGYRWADRPGGMWAAVSAVLVLQPGFRRSLAASAIRVIANLLGVGIGVLVATLIHDRTVGVCVSLVVIILLCEAARLDHGVRSACASVLIVSIGSDQLLERGLERATAVSIGCGVAIVLQLIMHPIIRRLAKATDLPFSPQE